MHKITGRLTNIVEAESKVKKKPHKILQMLSPENGFIHEIHGEIITITPANMDGADCQAIRMLTNGGKYMSTDRLIDWNCERKWKTGEIVIYGLPTIKIKNNKAIPVFELLEDQEKPEQVLAGEVFLKQVIDWQLREWRAGDVTLNVRLDPYFNPETGSRGYRYVLEDNQG